jgi:hypothetical protein
MMFRGWYLLFGAFPGYWEGLLKEEGIYGWI